MQPHNKRPWWAGSGPSSPASPRRRRTPAPVCDVVGGGFRPNMYPWRRIVVPTDFSTASEWVFDDAVRLAATTDAELVILHIRMTRTSNPSQLRFPPPPPPLPPPHPRRTHQHSGRRPPA